MRDRSVSPPSRAAGRRPPFSIDVIVFTPRGKQLAALHVRADDPHARERWVLPHGEPRGAETLESAARRVAEEAAGVPPAWIEQVGAFGDGKRHPVEAPLSIAFAAVIPASVAREPSVDYAWFGADEPPALAPRQRAMLDAALATLGARMDQAPIAFRLLPPLFTLTELQQAYELLLGRRLHKASFRRALQSAYLVEPTDEWRSEGRGRPAQFFRYAPRRRRSARRAVRFDLLR
jgi:hypothetical protein